MRKQFVAGFLLLLLGACAEVPHEQPAASAAPDAASLVNIADAARSDGRFSEAVEIYQQVLVSDQKSVAAQYGTAECLFALGRAADAKKLFAALESNPQYRAQALQGEGLSDLILNEREKAAKSLRDAVAADPKLWRANNALGLLADLKQETDQAQEFYAKALAVNPDSAMLLNNRGYSLLLSGKPDRAIEDLRKALALEPNSDTVLNNLRIAIASKGDYREATRGVSPEKMPVVMNNVGYVAMKRGDLAQAELYLTRAMTLSPNYNVKAAENMNRLTGMEGDNQ